MIQIENGTIAFYAYLKFTRDQFRLKVEVRNVLKSFKLR